MWDWALFQDLNGLAARHDGFEDVLRFFAVDTQVLFLALLAVLFLARGKWASRNARRGVAAAGFSALLALGAAQLIAHAVDRLRPYEAHPGDTHLFVPASHDPSFPSDHATAAFAIAVAIALRSRRAGALALLLATIVSVARVAVGVHYPGDVLGGAALGALAALLLWIPPVRGPLHRLADWAASLYERAAVAAARQAAAIGPSSGSRS
jgi:undecaprenyl-diphosphatase